VTPDRTSTVIHVSPHPDDELIGAGASLMALRDAGHEILNLAVGLGRPEVWDRRRAELEDACGRAGFSLRIADPPIRISRNDDLDRAQRRLTALLLDLFAETGAPIVVSPSPQDGHHGHEVVGRAVREAIRAAADPPTWWMWGLWADLLAPTILSPFDESRLDELVRALDAYTLELERNDYRRLVEGRAMANAILGPERIFGDGSAGTSAAYAELLSEATRRDGVWRLGTPRELDGRSPAPAAAGIRADAWIDSPSLAERLKGGSSA
jgi:LmbE family N-acetylglucosaminyl deacetylase